MLSKIQKSKMYESLFEDLMRYRLSWNAGIEADAREALLSAKAKLKIINIVGGRELADELCVMFEEFDDQQTKNRDKELENEDGDPAIFDPLNLTGAFDLAADRIIDGWFR